MKLKRPDGSLDAATLKNEFPDLADPRLHYLDGAATPNVVLNALRNFEIQARANVHEEGLYSRARVGILTLVVPAASSTRTGLSAHPPARNILVTS